MSLIQSTHMATEKKVLLAAPRGYCAGVDRAVVTVQKALEVYGAPVYVRKQIVHNIHVVRDLEARGAVFVESEQDAPAGAVLGDSPAVRRVLEVVSRVADTGVTCYTCHRGKNVPEGQKSLAYAFTYRSPEKTLTDTEVNAAHTKVVDALKACVYRSFGFEHHLHDFIDKNITKWNAKNWKYSSIF